MAGFDDEAALRSVAARAAVRRVTRGFDPGEGDVQIEAEAEAYRAFFSVQEYDLRYRRFDGSFSPLVRRAAFVSADAVTVLPYDAARDRVLLIEQFRTGPMARGDVNPWQFEAIAGRIDADEAVEDAARREAVEEAGLQLGVLLPVARYYPSPGISAECLYSYVGLCDLPDGVEGVFGLAGEAEDIRGHLIGFEEAMAMATSGEIVNAPTLLTLFWLAGQRDRLRFTG